MNQHDRNCTANAGYECNCRKDRQPKSDLGERVLDFMLLKLPGQPKGMHVGTSNLVNDLWSEVKRLRKLLNTEKVVCNGNDIRANEEIG